MNVLFLEGSCDGQQRVLPDDLRHGDLWRVPVMPPISFADELPDIATTLKTETYTLTRDRYGTWLALFVG